MMRTPLGPSEGYVKRTRMYRFMETVNQKRGLELDYKALYRWSVDNIPDSGEISGSFWT